MSKNGSDLPVSRRGFLLGTLAAALAPYIPKWKHPEPLPAVAYSGPLVAVKNWRFSTRTREISEFGSGWDSLPARMEWDYDLGVAVHPGAARQAIRQAQERLGAPMMIRTEWMRGTVVCGTAIITEFEHRRGAYCGPDGEEWDALMLHFDGIDAPISVAADAPQLAMTDGAWLLEEPARELRRGRLLAALGAGA